MLSGGQPTEARHAVGQVCDLTCENRKYITTDQDTRSVNPSVSIRAVRG
jgi:hypothetical protein